MAAKYEPIYATPNGLGDARPTALQILEDEGLIGKWPDRSILVTGCSSGIGIETAKALDRTGAHVYATARDLDKARAALGPIIDDERFHPVELDLSSLVKVRRFSEKFLSQSPRLHILIASADVMATPEGRTVDGFETQLGTNHIGHFLLIQSLLPALESSSSPDFRSRIIILFSSAHRGSKVNLDDLNLEAGVYPGGILTGITKHVPEEAMAGFATDALLAKMMKSPEQGAATSVWAATAKALEDKGGKYLEDCQISKPVQDGAHQFGPGYCDWTYDEHGASALWEKSMELVAPWLPS